MAKHVFFIWFIFTIVAAAQHSAHTGHAMQEHEGSDGSLVLTGMPSVLSTVVPMSMDGSGTGWLPSRSRLPMHMSHSGDWMVMTHGSAFLRYTRQGGPRGTKEWSMPNWFMASVQRPFSDGQQIAFRGMLSLDRLTDGGDGYPLLLQSGESWQGERLVDRQHPHDMVTELSAMYSARWGHEAGVFLYAGYPGEPALGPAAFMHRPAARYNPDAPISHHWQDATHITFGVATLGMILQSVKVEGSVFTGREPDENRFAFDRPRFDSYSGRVTWNPGPQWSLQTSYGYITDPEGHGDDVERLTASLLYSETGEHDDEYHASLVWGRNVDHHRILNSLLAELMVDRGVYSLYGRYENVGKPRFELGLTTDPWHVESLHQMTAGVSLPVMETELVTLRAGVQSSVSLISAELEKVYGRDPVSWQVVFQIQ